MSEYRSKKLSRRLEKIEEQLKGAAMKERLSKDPKMAGLELKAMGIAARAKKEGIC